MGGSMHFPPQGHLKSLWVGAGLVILLPLKLKLQGTVVGGGLGAEAAIAPQAGLLGAVAEEGRVSARN